jgi:MOSC domain-containing protein YiiM
VPKLPVERAEVSFAGVAGDRQTHRIHHGRPWQALCIWSADVIARLRDDGHPIAAGCAGENLTVAGLPWEHVRPGVTLAVGEVLARVHAFTEPCATNARWFRDGDFTVMHARRGPVSRVYASVLRPGTIAAGDAVTLEPAEAATAPPR